jgi:uncharacterized protein YjbJ (UPF0337 family)
MHKDEMKGAATDAKGAIKKTAGRATGDERLEGQGLADQAKGKLQKAAGKVKDAARRALRH